MFNTSNKNKIYILIFSLLLFNQILIYPQLVRSTIHGTITNKTTKKSVQNTNVYLAYTMLGSSTNEKGEYSIENIPPGRYTLVISHVGYEALNINIDINNIGNYRSDHKLVPKVYQFPEISVTVDDQDDREDNIEIFREAFIGTSDFAELTTIENPIALNFEWKDREHLFATADEALVIINSALGYKIEYTLIYFEYNLKYVKYSGFPKFNLLNSTDKDSLLIWERNREKVYKGSLRQFLYLISKKYSNLIEEKIETTQGWEYFSKNNIKKPKKIDENFMKNYGLEVFYKSTLEKKFDYKPIVFKVNTNNYLSPSKNLNELYLKFNNFFEVWYLDPSEDDENNTTISWIKLEKDSVIIDKMGRYYETFGIKSSGFWATQRLAETLPYEYVLPDSISLK